MSPVSATGTAADSEATCPPVGSAVIEVCNVIKTYVNGDTYTPALRGVSLHVEEGEFIAIMGPSGSGKSTLMNVLGLLDTPTAGSYHIRGADVSKLEEIELAEVRAREIGFVFQSFNLLPRASSIRNVVLPLIYTRVPVHERQARVEAALRAADLEESLWGKAPNQMSGGQMQRVAIARSLVNNPALILADEPTGNLDTKTGAFILKTFERLRDEGRTIVLITHEPEVAEHADRTIHIRDGLITDAETAYATDAQLAAAAQVEEPTTRPEAGDVR
ncbi:MAG: ABC transporter [Actinobacteria bacterium HGW-Actinobacteria-7]|jgi:putative ABC transport system ATP-binding protein|nr:MAG: ABC transporter [Actinobacteria bacterium HGW-Actinobacteria-7]